MTTAPVDPRILHKAREETRDALHDLCDPIKRGFLTDSMTVSQHVAPSLLDQLREAVATGRERGAGRRGLGLPISVDAHDLLTEIGRRTIWLVRETGATPAGQDVEPNLREVVASCGLSLDLESVLGVRGFLRAWTNSIRTLFDPPKRWALWGFSCPECDEHTVWRLDDSDGEEKRTAALEVAFTETDGGEQRIRDVHCLACQEEWVPSQLLFLGRLLGCEIPGVDTEGEPAA